MSRSNQQLDRLIQELIRLVQTGKLKVRWIVALVVLVVGYFLLQPVWQRSLGIDLPGLRDRATRTPTTGTGPADTGASGGGAYGGGANRRENHAAHDGSQKTAASPRASTAAPAGGHLQKILSSQSGESYRSPAGLRYTRGSQQGHRLKHLMAHTRDEPDRPGQHGVFDSDDPAEVVALVDQAYLQAQIGRDTRTRHEAERTVYDVNLRRRIGYIGGISGNRQQRPTANHLRLVVEGDQLITAFPVRP